VKKWWAHLSDPQLAVGIMAMPLVYGGNGIGIYLGYDLVRFFGLKMGDGPLIRGDLKKSEETRLTSGWNRVLHFQTTHLNFDEVSNYL